MEDPETRKQAEEMGGRVGEGVQHDHDADDDDSPLPPIPDPSTVRTYSDSDSFSSSSRSSGEFSLRPFSPREIRLRTHNKGEVAFHQRSTAYPAKSTDIMSHSIGLLTGRMTSLAIETQRDTHDDTTHEATHTANGLSLTAAAPAVPNPAVGGMSTNDVTANDDSGCVARPFMRRVDSVELLKTKRSHSASLDSHEGHRTALDKAGSSSTVDSSASPTECGSSASQPPSDYSEVSTACSEGALRLQPPPSVKSPHTCIAWVHAHKGKDGFLDRLSQKGNGGGGYTIHTEDKGKGGAAQGLKKPLGKQAFKMSSVHGPPMPTDSFGRLQKFDARGRKMRFDAHGTRISRNGKKHKVSFRDEMLSMPLCDIHIVFEDRPDPPAGRQLTFQDLQSRHHQMEALPLRSSLGHLHDLERRAVIGKGTYMSAMANALAASPPTQRPQDDACVIS
ncbi:unnamed protein product [Vitrella brassicaformis CCMP3155]|uniref:Uncharacterized protein n=2 Tax=Vitrella brassicaformis TaxID=1169539 RepID=A0A0G4F4J3_VITBC|nr:unnamed protein product [Vitrella brassicaformis CCMP3155]|mmetsp:Transcript_21591/g.52906  ORF Transcript_21591/g.52906 Transcript_21591/m.52906 type:complete len:448 (+) Transcript_21591:282-1625(+)|eukprot:CEM06826.1 unnamed protein product [Vitrella brassicaformis CCMP3155]